MAALSERKSGLTEEIDFRDASLTVPSVSPREDARPASENARFTAKLHWNRSDCEAAWLRLQTEGISTAYQTALWIDCVCAFMVNAAVRPFFVELIDQDSDATVMLLAFTLTQRWGVKTINWLNFGVCDYAAPLLAADWVWSIEAAGSAWAAITAAMPPADLIDIVQIPRDFGGAINPLALLPQRRLMDMKAFGVPLNRGAKQPATYSMASKPLRELNRRRRRLECEGEVRFVEAVSEADVDEIFGVMLHQRRQRFERLGRFDLLSRPHVTAFYRQAAVRGLREGGTARIFGVRVDDEWISTAYVLVHGGVFHGIIMSMGEERWTKFGPGILIVTELLKWSERQGHTYFDMTIGDVPYKNDIGPQQQDLFRILQAETLIGRGAIWGISAFNQIDSTIRARPALFNSMRRVRQTIRRLTRLLFQHR